MEYCVISKRIAPVSELKTILFELFEKSKEIKLDTVTIKNFQSAYEIVTKICSAFQESNINLIYEARSSIRTLEVCVKFLPGSNIESQEFFERFIDLMNPFVNKLSVCYGL